MNGDFNQSRDDPWNRAWLTSRELFVAYHNVARHGGEAIHHVLDGTVFGFGRGGDHWIQIWLSPTELIVAYPPFGERYGHHDETEGLHEFDGWIHHLRNSEPLELGRARERSSYGATCAPGTDTTPVLKWGQRGDWMFTYRNWPILPEEWPTHCSDPHRMLVALPAPASDRKRRLLSAAFCRNAWHLFANESARWMVEVAERHADGGASAEELATACADAEAVAGFWFGVQPGYGETNPARSTFVGLETLTLAYRVVRHVSEIAFRVAETHTQSEQAATEAEYAAWASEQAAQCDLIREVFGNPFKPIAFDPAWLTSDVVALARGIDADRAFDRMPILADALQDAGCDNNDVLNHCRDAKQVHARGCWVIDLLLGRE